MSQLYGSKIHFSRALQLQRARGHSRRLAGTRGTEILTKIDRETHPEPHKETLNPRGEREEINSTYSLRNLTRGLM